MRLVTAIALLASAPAAARAVTPVDAPPLAPAPVPRTPAARVYLAFRGGAYRPSGGVETPARYDEALDLEVTFGLPLTRHLAVEGSVGRYGGRTGRRSVAGGAGPDVPAASLEKEVSVVPIATSIRATAHAARFALSLVAGAGIHMATAETTVDSPFLGSSRTASEDDRALGVHVGGGVALAITERIRVGIEIVRTFVSVLSMGDGGLTARPDEIDLDGFRGGATLAFRM